MSKNLGFLIASVVLLGSLVVGGCSPAVPEPEGKIERITIAAGSIGGTSNVMANSYAGVLKKYVDVIATVVTYPMVRTPVAPGTGETAIGLSTSQESFDAWEGVGTRAGQEPLRELREIMSRATMPLQIFVLEDSPFKTFGDLVGERVSPGAKGMGSAMAFSNVCEVLGLDLSKDFDVAYMGHADGSAALVSGKLSAYIALGPPPHPTLMATDLTRPLRLIGFSQQDAKAIAEAVPGMGTGVIPPKFYHMAEPVLTIASIGQVLTRSDFSESIVYGLVKNTIEHPDFIGYYSDALRKFLEDKDSGIKYWVEVSPSPTDIPFHKAAVRYYTEIGWKVPAERIPPEMQK